MLSQKVSETRGKRMQDFTLNVTPVAVAAAAVANQIDDIANGVQRDTIRSVSPVLKEQSAVKRISQKFSSPTVSANSVEPTYKASPSTSSTGPTTEAAPEASSIPIDEGYDV